MVWLNSFIRKLGDKVDVVVWMMLTLGMMHSSLYIVFYITFCFNHCVILMFCCDMRRTRT
jgi:hypothetical protein